MGIKLQFVKPGIGGDGRDWACHTQQGAEPRGISGTGTYRRRIRGAGEGAVITDKRERRSSHQTAFPHSTNAVIIIITFIFTFK